MNQQIELSDGTKIILPKSDTKLKKMTREEFCKRQESNKSINTPQQWACKFDAFLFNEYEFTLEELDELHTDRRRQIRRETSPKITD